MKSGLSFSTIFLVVILVFVIHVTPANANQKKFTVVLDAGHGGRDPGAVGRISKEKDIVLAVTKLVGNMIEKNMNDVKVVYTRTTDVFITLEGRAAVANNNNADMFISIHTNAAQNKSAYGAETYTLGLAKTKANLDVAMAENSVMLLEDDYKTRYRGFDPSSVDSYIMFEFMMDKYLDNSIEFATYIQQQFVGFAKRHDRGVRQAGFWVLHQSACPSVLVELGFISNYTEELYMASPKGQQELATSIYNAFVKYKRAYDRKLGYVNSGSNSAPIIEAPQPTTSPVAVGQTAPVTVTPTAQTVNADVPIFKIQLKSSPKPLDLNAAEFRGLSDLSFFREGGLYKYTYGAETDYQKISQLRREVQSRFPDAFVIAFLGDNKISVNEAINFQKK